jgi:hypothetical protein
MLLSVDSVEHHNKVKQWSLNPTQFCHEMESKQKYPSWQMYLPLSITHPTEECAVKKNVVIYWWWNVREVPLCLLLLNLLGMYERGYILRYCFSWWCLWYWGATNDTNKDDVYYFAWMTHHYLCLVKASPTLSVYSRHQMKFPIITDSGANFHMFKEY